MKEKHCLKLKSSKIPVKTYFKYALSLTSKELKLIKDFSRWLPNEIIDVHVHSSTRQQCKFIDRDYFSDLSSTFPWFEIKKHNKINQFLYPKKKVKMIVFPIPFRGIDHRSANKYILRQSKRNSSIFPVLYGLPDDIEYTISCLKTRRFYGLKMYPAYFSPRAQKICEYFPDQVLKCCETMRIPIILHLPQPIVDCEEELSVIVRKFPNLKIVLAHMGRVYLPIKGLKKTFTLLSKYKNIYLDTALVTSAEVFKMAIETFGPHRVIYGTDQPLNLVRGRMYCNPIFGARVATEYPYHWADPKEQKNFARYAVGATHLHWETLRALREAIDSYRDSKDIKSYIFRENAKRVFGL